jgi:putative photosynthetic complex assembly protein 2
VSWGSDHATAFWTFAVLLVMRLSTKFNLYLGVANFTDGFLPASMGYLKTYFRKRPWNGLMGLSLLGALGLALWWGQLALDAPSGSASQFGAALVCVLALLGILEHGFLMLPLEEAALWRWAMAGQRTSSATQTEAGTIVTDWRRREQSAVKAPPKAVLQPPQND